MRGHPSGNSATAESFSLHQRLQQCRSPAHASDTSQDRVPTRHPVIGMSKAALSGFGDRDKWRESPCRSSAESAPSSTMLRRTSRQLRGHGPFHARWQRFPRHDHYTGQIAQCTRQRLIGDEIAWRLEARAHAEQQCRTLLHSVSNRSYL